MVPYMNPGSWPPMSPDWNGRLLLETCFWLLAVVLLIIWLVRLVRKYHGEPLLWVLAALPFLIAAANLVDICAIVVTQGKTPAEDVVKMAEKAEIPIFTTGLTRWQVATRLYEAGIR